MPLIIYKYSVPIDDKFILHLPAKVCSRVLDLQFQRGQPCVWVLLDPTLPKIERHFVLYGTGHELPERVIDDDYIGTFQPSDNLVFHLFEVID